jgi:hypothetical protein
MFGMSAFPQYFAKGDKTKVAYSQADVVKLEFEGWRPSAAADPKQRLREADVDAEIARTSAAKPESVVQREESGEAPSPEPPPFASAEESDESAVHSWETNGGTPSAETKPKPQAPRRRD